MALADPQTVTVAATPNTLPKVSPGEYRSVYQKDDRTVKLTVSHQPGKARSRATTRLDVSKIAADPFQTAVNREVGASFGFYADVPNQGYTAAELKDNAAALIAWLTASSNANLIKILAGEH